MATTATAVIAAATVIHVFLGWQAAEFESLGHVLHDVFLDAVHFALGIEEVLGDLIIQQGVAVLVEIFDLLFRELHAHLLLLLQHLAFEAQGIILAAGSVIFEEGADLAAEALKFRVVQDGFAKLGGLGGNRRVGFGSNHVFAFR